MKLTLDDVKALAKVRHPEVLPPVFWVACLLLLMLAASVTLTPRAIRDTSEHYRLPDGQELVLDNGQMTLGNIIVERVSVPDDTVLWVGGTAYLLVAIAGAIYVGLAGEPARKRQKDFIAHWIEKRELPE